jgi:cellulose biosynthesis protein BcsQ
LLPADFSFRNLNLVLDAKKKPNRQLKKLLKPLATEYDYIFLDCPQNISLLSEAVFEASDILLSPIIPTTLSLRTLEQLKEFIEDNKLHKLALIPFFFDGRSAKNNAQGYYGKSGEASSGNFKYRYSLCQRYRKYGTGTYAIKRLNQ